MIIIGAMSNEIMSMQVLNTQHREVMMVKMILIYDSVTFIHSDLFNHLTSIKIHLYFSDGTTKTQSHYIQSP